MPVKHRNELYGLFATGNKPTHDDFIDLIDSAINLVDDGLGISEKGKPMEITYQGEMRRLLDFSSAPGTPIWRLGALSNDGLSNGLNIASTASRFFIKQDKGLTGINTDNPTAQLHIVPDSGVAALRVGSSLTNPLLAIEGSGHIGIGTNAEVDQKVTIDGAVKITEGANIGGLVQAGNGITVNGAKLIANQGLDVTNGAAISGTFEAGNGLTVNGSALIAAAGATISGGATVNGGSTLNGGATVKGGALNAAAGATISGGATVNGGSTLNGGATVNGGALNAAAGATISGGATVNGGSTLNGGATIGGGAIINDDFLKANAGLKVKLGLTIETGGLLAQDGATLSTADVSNGLTVSGGATIKTGKLEAKAGATITGAMEALNTLTVSGLATFKKGISVESDGISVKGGLSVISGDLTASGPVALGCVDTGSVTISGPLFAGQGITVTLGSLKAQDSLEVSKGLTVNGGLTVNTGTLNAKGGISVPDVLTVTLPDPDDPANLLGTANVSGVLKATNGAEISGAQLIANQGLKVIGKLDASGDAALGSVNITNLDVTNIRITGRFGLNSISLQSLTATKAEIQDLTVGGLAISGSCLASNDFIFASGMLYATYQGPGSLTPRIKVMKGIVTGTRADTGLYNFNFDIDENKLVKIIYDQNSDISNFLYDWEDYKAKQPSAKTEGFYFTRVGQNLWKPRDMEISIEAAPQPYKECLLTPQGLRIIYSGGSTGNPRLVVKKNDDLSIQGFVFEIGGLTLTIKYPSDEAYRTPVRLLQDWNTATSINLISLGEFEIQKTADNGQIITDAALDFTVNGPNYFYKGIIKTNTVSLQGYLKFEGSPSLISGISNHSNLAENSDYFLATQKAVKTYVDGKISDGTLTSNNSSSLAPTQQAVKTYVDGKISDGTLTSNSSSSLAPTQQAVKTYVDGKISDGTLTSNSSSSLAPTQQAVKTYVDGKISDGTLTSNNSSSLAPTQQSVKTYVDGKISDGTLTSNNSSSLAPTQQAVKTYVDGKISDGTLTNNSTSLAPTQQAVKTYVDGKISNGALTGNSTSLAPTQQAVKSYVDTSLDGKISNGALTGNSTSLAPTQQAVKTYVDGKISNGALTGNSTALAPTQQAVKTYVDDGLLSKANQADLDAKVGAQKLAGLPVLAKGIGLIADLGGAADSRGLLMVLIKNEGGAILSSGIFTLHPPEIIIKLAGNGIGAAPAQDTYNLFYDNGSLTAQNTSEQNIIITVTYFGA